MVAPPCLPVPPQGYGGTELVVAELIDGLSEQGAEISLFAAPGSRGGFDHACAVESPLGVPIWPPNDEAERLHCRRAFERIAEHRFDVVHAHCPAAAELAWNLEVPVVLTVHHDRNAAYSAGYARSPRVHYAFISESQRAQEVALSRSSVVHHGLSPERYPKGAGQGDYAAFVGRFSACKGLHHAVDASRLANVPLHAAGKPHPPDLAYFHAELADRLGQPGVQWLGEANHARKVALLQGARALLFPIEWDEPFGLVMVEAMLCGTPVLAFPHGAAPELVEPGLTGFLVRSVKEMANALERLARRGFDRAACRARAIERFGRDAMVAGYLELYARALAERGLATAETHG